MCLPSLGLPGEIIQPKQDGYVPTYFCDPLPGLRIAVADFGDEGYRVVAGRPKPPESWNQCTFHTPYFYDRFADCELQAIGIVHHLIAEYKAGNLRG